jgi:hypothetical protein
MTSRRTSVRLAVVLVGVAILLFGFAVPLLALSAPAAPAVHGSPRAPEVLGGPPAPLGPAAHAAPPAAASPGPSATTASGGFPPRGWNSSNFFTDVAVRFYGTGLPLGFRTVPYVNQIPASVLGFWMNITATAPIAFANLTIWGTSWPGTNLSTGINGYAPNAPAKKTMVVNSTDPAEASFFFDDYRFFWPGSSVSFNLTVVGVNSTPSLVESASNLSVPNDYPGGFTNLATWSFVTTSPWASTNFTSDIAITTTPNVVSQPIYDPNPDQAVSVTIAAIPVNGVVTPIPAARLSFTVITNQSTETYSEGFGPVNHTVETAPPIGPYPGGTVKFNVSAWLPFQGGVVDSIQSGVYNFSWSTHGGWWHPLGGLTENLQLTASPSVTFAPATGGSMAKLPTDQPVSIQLHEPIENVTIQSAQVEFTFVGQGGSNAGTIPMTALTDNTSVAVLPGLPAGGLLSFSVIAKDIYGDPVSSGNYSYTELGPTSPPLPAGSGLLFIEVLDLSGSSLDSAFSWAVANASWSANGSANALGFASPLLPSSSAPVELKFGEYFVSVRTASGLEEATVEVSATSPTPTVVFYTSSQPGAVAPNQTLTAESALEAGGLIAAAVVTLPLVAWFDERRSKAEAEQRRVTL